MAFTYKTSFSLCPSTRLHSRLYSRLHSLHPFHTKHTKHTKQPHSSKALFSTSKSDTEILNNNQEKNANFQKLRINALHTQLQIISKNINPDSLADAATRSLTTTDGYDPQFGKPAIRTYRSFLKYPPKNPHENLEVAATRTARQIDFLMKRHKSQEADWVRHLDAHRRSQNANDKDGEIFANNQTTQFPLSLILDNVRSAFNVGSIFRTADACGCTEIITTGITPHPSGSGREKLSKCALGADKAVSTRHFATTVEAIETLREEGDVMLVGMETTERSQIYTSTAITYKQEENGTYLILGNEVSGVDTEIMDMLDLVVEIPMFGAKNSLNIAASAPVVMYEVLRQWKALEKEKE